MATASARPPVPEAPFPVAPDGADRPIPPEIAALVAPHLPVAKLSLAGAPEALVQAPLVACVPACDEAGRIDRCLAALDAELAPGEAILVLANGCTDATPVLAGAALSRMARPTLLVECRWQPGRGSAPFARRLALDLATGLAPEALLLSIDGDTLVLPGLRAAYAAEFARGFDLVCGRIGFLPDEAARLPPADPASDALIRACRDLSRQIAARLCPDPDNPWPHHGNIGGANFAMRGLAYRQAGGLPTPPSGEDRALRALFEAHGLRIRHSDGPRVETSCRLDGRATGGLAEELRRNRTEADPLVDELLEPADRLVLRARARAAFRAAPDAEARRAALAPLGLAEETAGRLARLGTGLALREAEEASPVLRRERLRLSDLRPLEPALRRALADIEGARSDSPAFPSP
ncbi:hypothetical protein GCM10011390_35160 [Aureimonas endophytica]|uniref:Glycosyl transferase family 2 n=1 Tax=Aureimonas endophytica TaxID=2027858 RepID=A0A916ZU93_9HYPH|nr:hypothetical protein [Aureimonas endophytica]GGE13012.1 hypothetical protein GCM10011390_35160 [Aureimonas endophytica]